ncbi:hypothetical protein EON65_55660 [archaeon]|nr:MAG: hypothetical protein EON65_55660 [archaeon]
MVQAPSSDDAINKQVLNRPALLLFTHFYCNREFDDDYNNSWHERDLALTSPSSLQISRS